jgi:hypothetical protein
MHSVDVLLLGRNVLPSTTTNIKNNITTKWARKTNKIEIKLNYYNPPWLLDWLLDSTVRHDLFLNMNTELPLLLPKIRSKSCYYGHMGRTIPKIFCNSLLVLCLLLWICNTLVVHRWCFRIFPGACSGIVQRERRWNTNRGRGGYEVCVSASIGGEAGEGRPARQRRWGRREEGLHDHSG